MEKYEVGETVAVRSFSDGLNIGIVKKITPSGRVVVKVGNRSDMTFNQDGLMRGSTSYYSVRLTKMTQKDWDEMEHLKLRIIINRVNWNLQSLDVLRAVYELVGV